MTERTSVVEAGGFKWFVPPERYRNLPLENHERPEREWVRENIPRGGLFVDIGANSGIWTISLADRFDEIVAIEPHPMNLMVLRKNIELNGLKNVRVEPVAAWRENCWLKLNQSYEDDYASDIIAIPDELARAMKMIHVLAKSVDSMRMVPAFVKIDVEGAELEVLKGMEKTMLAHHPSLHIEVHTNLTRYSVSRGGAQTDKDLVRASVEPLGYELVREIELHQVYVERGRWKQSPAQASHTSMRT